MQRKYVHRSTTMHTLVSTLCVLFNSTQLNSTPPEGGLNKGKEARKLKNIPDALNDSQVFFESIYSNTVQ